VKEDGTHYEIDPVLDTRPAASLKAGGVGLRYKIVVRGRETAMYLEEDNGGAKRFLERR